MIKARKKFSVKTMRRTYKVRLSWLNETKRKSCVLFLQLHHDMEQYFVDLFWSRRDFNGHLADLATVHKGRDKFNTTTRLAQSAAKQAKELCRAADANGHSKPELHRHSAMLCYHFATVEEYHNNGFDYAVRLTGSGAPRLTLPVKSTKPINKKLKDGWSLGNSVRLSRDKDGVVCVELFLEKAKPLLKTAGAVVGLDSNYKNGMVLSDGQNTGMDIYKRVQTFAPRQRNTHKEIDSLTGAAVNAIDLTNVRTLCIENLKNVKSGKRGTFPRGLNRRMSHWLYASATDRLARKCEEHGVRLERKNPWKTSQFCRACGKWDKRSRVGDKFKCVFCGHSEHADHNAAKNLELLGTAGVYGIRDLKASTFVRDVKF